VAGVIALGAIDDDRMLLDGLGVWLNGQTDLRLVAWAGTVEEFFAASLDHPADVVLLDIRLSDAPIRCAMSAD
jgi:DNA-binding NarL/FixJ family response regulator